MPRTPPPKDRFAMLKETEAAAVLACAKLGMTNRDWMERAGQMMLAWSRDELRQRNYRAACVEADKFNRPTPRPQDFGLPVPPAFRDG